MTLATIYEKYRHLTDKGTRHSYLETYERLFEPYRTQVVSLLEIGVQCGGSLLMWAEFLPGAAITGLEVEAPIPRTCGLYQCHAPYERVQVHYGCNVMHLSEASGPLNIVIDDGSHLLGEQVAAFKFLWPRLLPGGMYVIEDVQRDADRDALLAFHPFEVIDLRDQKPGVWDNVLMVARK